MPAPASAQPPSAIERLQRAWNTHDLDALAACFRPGYASTHPLHPDWGLAGVKQMQRSWAALFDAIPDFQADLLRWAANGDTVWTEWRWSGASLDGAAVMGGGVMIFGLAGDQIVWMRGYTEMQSIAGPDWDAVLAEVLSR